MITVICTSCGKSYHVQDQVIGKAVKCRCGATFRAAAAKPRVHAPQAENAAAAGQILVCSNTACRKKYQLTKPHANLNGLHCTECRAPLVASEQTGMPPVPAAPPAWNWDELLPSGLSSAEHDRLKFLFQREDDGSPLSPNEVEERQSLIAKGLQRDSTACPCCGSALTSRVRCSGCNLDFATGVRRKGQWEDNPLIAKAKKEIEEEEQEALAEAQGGGTGGSLAGNLAAEILLNALFGG